MQFSQTFFSHSHSVNLYILYTNAKLQKNKDKILIFYAFPHIYLQFVGEAVISAQSGSKEAVINMINGVEPDCILSGLSYPWQEKFIAESKALLNARVWFGCTFLLNQQKKEEKASGKFKYCIPFR